MGFREVLLKKFSDKEKILLIRYKSSRVFLIFSILLFFINFYLAGGNFYYKISIKTLPFTYIFMLLSIFFYFLFVINIKLKNSKNFQFILIFLLSLIVLFLILPFIFKGGFLDIIYYFNKVIKYFNDIFVKYLS